MERFSTRAFAGVLLALVLSGCALLDGGAESSPNGTASASPTAPDKTTERPEPGAENVDYVLPLTKLSVPLADASNITVYNYSLGDADIVNTIGRPVPAPLAGIIAVPTTPGPHPLIIFLHGQMPVQSIADPVYQGFDYAVQQMAAQGYVAISVNINVNYSFEFGESAQDAWAYQILTKHLESLAAANSGATPLVVTQESGGEPEELDLTGKIDLKNISLVGHSRGGEVADMAYRYDRQAGFSRIKSIVHIAATVAIFDEPRPDIPTGIILPELDGDVDNLAQMIFDDNLELAAQRNSFTNLVFLRGANHNFFNRAFTPDDRFSGKGPANLDDQTTWLTREQQEDFLKRYLTAFYLQLSDPQATISNFDPAQAQPTSMFGLPVVASTAFPGAIRVIPIAQQGMEQQSLEQQGVTATGSATVNWYRQTFPAAMVTTGFFNHPGALARPSQAVDLYQITWGHSLFDSQAPLPETETPSVTIPLTVTDWQGYKALSLFIAVDSTTGYNIQNADQSLIIEINDASGQSWSVLAPVGTPALTGNQGWFEEIEDFGGSVTIWRGYTPLGELRIPLEQ
ncbi:MAG: hypothetical protein LBB58_05750, partial [Cellulomonadaceae bacterium]|nr:hypothetical protein [Cellulomonadaceae bacterium]